VDDADAPDLGFRIEELGAQRVRFLIPAQRTWESVTVLSTALVAWLACELVVGGVLYSLVSGRTANPGGAGGILFLAVWLLFWTYGGLMVVYQWYWLYAGVEIVDLTGNELQLRRVVPGYTRTRTFALADLRELRVDSIGQLRFMSGQEEVEFGQSLDALSARVLLEEIAVRHPHLPADSFYEGYSAA
jgi:hypothetical protein